MPMKLNRRTVLKGLLGGAAVSVALPTLNVFLDDNGTALADGSVLPRRFGVFFWGNGVIPDNWNPIGEGADYQLSEQLMPLAPIKHKLSVISGMRVSTGNDIAHASGAAGILSGAPLLVNDGDSHTFRQPSIDQVVAQALGGTTRFRSIEVAAQPGALGRSHNGPDSVNPPESNPFALYQRIFGDGFVAPGDDPIIDPRLGLRRSVLDAVMEDSARLSARVGAADRQRLDQHFTAVRDLEKQLALLEEDPPDLASCERPATPAESYPDVDGRPPLAEINAAMADLLAMAIACDQTRVFSYWFSDSVNNVLFPAAEAGHHRLTHDEPGNQPQVNSIVIYIMEQLSALLQRLDAVPEGDGTLLDNCAILGTTDCSFARQHLLEDYPILVAGSCCGALQQGIHYRSQTLENTSKVLLSLLRAMGLTLAEFGTEGGRVTDGLGAIEVGGQS